MKINNSCGAVAVIFNPEDNPGLFQKDNSYILKRFDLYERKCALISEGKKVTLISNLGNKREEELLSVYLPEGLEDKISSLVLKWYNNNLSLSISTLRTKNMLLSNSASNQTKVYFSGFT